MMIRLFGIPEMSNLTSLKTNLVQRVNGGGNLVRILPEDSAEAFITRRIQCECDIQGSVAEGKADVITGQVTRIVKDHFVEALGDVHVEIAFTLSEPRLVKTVA